MVMDIFFLISCIITASSIFFYIKGNLLIIQIDKDVWKFGLWKCWVSFKELKTRALNIADVMQRTKYEKAIKMLKLSKRLIILLLIGTVIHSIWFSA